MPINESEKLAELHMKRVADRNVAINVQNTKKSSPEASSNGYRDNVRNEK